jgi:hypothetical protein
MRTYSTFVVISLAWPIYALAGEEVEFQFDPAPSASPIVQASDPADGRGPFIANWKVEGIEEPIDLSGERSWVSRKTCSAPPIDRQQLFEGMWSPLSLKPSVKPANYRYRYRNDKFFCEAPSPPSSLPPLNPRWLVDELWPRTRCHLDGEEFNPTQCWSWQKTIDDSDPSSLIL